MQEISENPTDFLATTKIGDTLKTDSSNRQDEALITSDSEKDLDTNGEGDKENESEESDEENDPEEGWITSDNIAEMQKKMGAMVLDKDSTVSVACISTDFSIQVSQNISLNPRRFKLKFKP